MDGPKTATANYREAQYQLNVAIIGTGTVTKDPDKLTYRYGDRVTLTATSGAGWSFSGWSGDLSGTSSFTTILMDGDKSITALFTQNEYTLAVTIAGGGTVTRTPNQATYVHGSQVQLAATADDGWDFGGWSGDLISADNPATITMDGYKAVTATFLGRVGPLAYAGHQVDDDQVGASSGNGDGFVDCGESVELLVNLLNTGGAAVLSVNGTLSTNDGYVTMGSAASAYGDVAGKAIGTNLTKYSFQVSADTPHLHPVTFNLNATGANGGPWPLTFDVPVACEQNMGKVDKSVVSSGDDAEELVSTGAVTVQRPALALGQDIAGAQWVGLRFQSLFIPKGAPIGQAWIELTAAQAGGGAASLTFLGEKSANAPAFVGDGSASTADQAGSLDLTTHNLSSRARTTATVPWSSVPAWAQGGTYQSPDLAPIIQEIVNQDGWVPGNALALLINGTGARIAHSYDGAAADAPRLWIEFGGDLTCYTLGKAVSPTSGGSITASPSANCGADRYVEGTLVELKAEPALDHAFTGWRGDLQSTDNPVTITMDSAKALIADFSKETCYTLTTGVEPAASGTVAVSPEPNCGGGKYVAGTTVQLTATPQGAVEFFYWTGAPAGSEQQNPLSLTMDANKSIAAYFATCHSLTALALPAGAGSVSAEPAPNCGDGWYMAGTPVQLTALPAQGYSFANWSGATSGLENPTTVTVNADLLVLANFEQGACRTFIARAVPAGSATLSIDPPPNCPDGKYESGTRVQVTVQPKAGFVFRGWSGAASGSDNPVAIVVGNQTTVTAELELETIQSTISLPVVAR
jgi:hypothetical protein